MPSSICGYCRGDGKCSECSGTGVNVHINEAEPKCRNCSGTGVCPISKGSGKSNGYSPLIRDL